MSREKEDLKALDLKRLTKDPTEVELCKLASKEILEQFSECVDNFRKMIDMYPLMKATVSVALQIRFCGEEQITCLAGAAKTVRESLQDMTLKIMKD